MENEFKKLINAVRKPAMKDETWKEDMQRDAEEYEASLYEDENDDE